MFLKTIVLCNFQWRLNKLNEYLMLKLSQWNSIPKYTCHIFDICVKHLKTRFYIGHSISYINQLLLLFEQIHLKKKRHAFYSMKCVKFVMSIDLEKRGLSGTAANSSNACMHARILYKISSQLLSKRYLNR